MYRFCIFLFCFSFSFLSVFAQNTLEIKKKKTILYSYTGSESLLNIRFIGTGMSIKEEKTKKYIFVQIDNPLTASGKIIFESKKTTKEFSIKISNHLKIRDINIFPTLSFSRLQEKPLTCEASALSDILSHLLNKEIQEQEVFNHIPKSDFYKQLPKIIDGKKVWGDPESGFVGYENFFRKGKEIILPEQGKMTGYGVYEKPLSKVVEEIYGLKTKIQNQSFYTELYGEKNHLRDLLQSVEDGNMVLLWGDWCTKASEDDGTVKSKWTLRMNASWKTKSAQNTCADIDENRVLDWYIYSQDGYKNHKGLSGEHAFYLLGYYGTPENPKQIHVWDTDTGRHTYSFKEWKRKWNLMSNRSLIIYK